MSKSTDPIHRCHQESKLQPESADGPSNFPYTRSQFSNNQIPSGRINPLSGSFLLQYVPSAEHDDGSAADSNNYSIRTENHIQDQGTFRVDHNFLERRHLLARYSAGGEMASPEQRHDLHDGKLPGFGVNFSNLSQQAWVVEPHFCEQQVIPSRLRFRVFDGPHFAE